MCTCDADFIDWKQSGSKQKSRSRRKSSRAPLGSWHCSDTQIGAVGGRDSPPRSRALLTRSVWPRSDQSGYLDKAEFKELLGTNGLNIKLPDEDMDLLISQLADKNGAIEATDFTRFLAVRAVC